MSRKQKKRRDRVLIPPHPFITYKNGEFHLNPVHKKALRRIREPIHVVSCVGRYRTGKSFFLNRLFKTQEEGGFELGRTIESATHGIWLWVKRIEGRVVMLVDTEGLYVPKNSGINFDNKIIALALLLSSTFILNTTGTLDRTSITQLEFVVELTKSMKAFSKRQAELGDYQEFFPSFIWLVRDFFLELMNDDGDVLSDREYLEYILQVEKPKKKEASAGSPVMEDEKDAKGEAERRRLVKTKTYIKEMFPRRQCFTLAQPTSDSRKLNRVHEMEYEELDPIFTKKLDVIVSTILGGLLKKQMFGKAWNGDIFYSMAEMFVEHVNSERFIVIDSSFSAVVKSNNVKVVAVAITKYTDDLKKHIEESLGGLPLEEDELMGAHQAILSECQEYIFSNAYESVDEDEFSPRKLVEKFTLDVVKYGEGDEGHVVVSGLLLDHFIRENLAVSEEKCNAFLKTKWKTIDEAFEELVKAITGKERYEEMREDIKEAYDAAKKLGPMKEKVYRQFLKDKESEAERFRMMNDFAADQRKKTRDLERKLDERKVELLHLRDDMDAEKNSLMRENLKLRDQIREDDAEAVAAEQGRKKKKKEFVFKKKGGFFASFSSGATGGKKRHKGKGSPSRRRVLPTVDLDDD